MPHRKPAGELKTVRPLNGPETIQVLGSVQHYVEVWLNDRLVGTLLWPPYRMELTASLKKGNNDLVLIVSNSIANRFAGDIWGTRGSTTPEPSGLLGPVTLLAAGDGRR